MLYPPGTTELYIPPITNVNIYLLAIPITGD